MKSTALTLILALAAPAFSAGAYPVSGNVVMLEHFAHIHGGLEIDTRRTLALRSVSDCG
jgi:hypothetical protein